MTVAELIKALEAMQTEHGDIEVVGYWDSNLWGISAVDFLGPSASDSRPFITLDVSDDIIT